MRPKQPKVAAGGPLPRPAADLVDPRHALVRLAGPVLETPCAGFGTAEAPELRLGAHEDPLALRLELARAPRVEWTRHSTAALAEQFTPGAGRCHGPRQLPLSRLAERLIMAVWPAALRARPCQGPNR